MADLLADLEAARARDRHVGRAGGDRNHRTIREGLPHGRGAAESASSAAAKTTAATGGCCRGSRRLDAGDLAGFHGGTGVDFNRIADVHTGRASDIDGGVTLLRGDRQSGVGQAEHVEAFGRELRPGRNLDRREDGQSGSGAESVSSWRGQLHWRRRCRAR